MLKNYNKKHKCLILSVLVTCLISIFGHSAVASSAKSNAGVLIPVYQLLFDNYVDEFGSIIPGKLYSAAELAFWQNRAKSSDGPHLVRGDAYGTLTTGSNPDYKIILGSAQSFENINDGEIVITGVSRTDLINEGISDAALAEIEFFGNCAAPTPGNGNTALAYFEFGRFDLARDAAFVDLIDGTSRYTSRIKRLLLEQAQEPCLDFSNRELFQFGPNYNGFWLYLEWLHRVFKTYDYLDSSVFTNNERTIIDKWFKGAAEWAHYYISTRHVGGIYDVRALNPIDSVIDLPSPNNPANTGYFLNREAFASLRIRYKGSSIFWPAAYVINNRHLGQLNFVVHAGVKYDNEEWKREGAQTVKEYVSFHFDDDGYYAELDRASDINSQAGIDIGIPNRAEHGLSYGANSLVNIAEIAHVLYLDGYENLFEYKSKARINQESGQIEIGTVEKSLEWVLLKFRENFMLENSPEIYSHVVPDGQENTDNIIHFCKNTNREKLGTNRVVGRMYHPAAILNRYYKNPIIKDIYNASDDYGNLCGYRDTNLEINPGPLGVLPGALFQYSDADEEY